MDKFDGKVGLIQRVLPNYRAPFFNQLGAACNDGLYVYAGQPRPNEMIKTAQSLENARLTLGQNLHLFKGSLYLCFQLGLIDWLEKSNPDVLIAEANPRYLRMPAAVRWMRRRSRPVIGWGLGAPDLTGPLSALRQRRRAAFINQFDIMITYSQTGAFEYARLGFPEDKIFVAINAVTPPPAHPLPQRPAPISTTKPRVLFVGRLQTRKNLDNLIIACSKLPESLQPDLVIVGDGPDRERIETLASKVYPSAQFTGALYDDALAYQFTQADLFVLPGTGGLAIQQAMSYGLPVIAAQADGTQADLVRPENGWQIPADDVQALNHALENALSDLPALRAMGAESYRIVSQEINLDQMVSVFVEALNRSLA